jgi:hypothetical protein
MARSRRAPAPPVVGEDEDDTDALPPMNEAPVGDIALLDDTMFDSVSWSVFRYRTDSEMRGDYASDKVEFVGKRYGPIDAEEFQTAFGGGTFDLRGYVPRIDEEGNRRGVRIAYRHPRVTVAGPRRDFTGKPAELVVANGKASSQDAPRGRLIRLLIQQQELAEKRRRIEDRRRDERFERMVTALKPVAPPPPAPTMMEQIALLKAMQDLTGKSQQAPVDLMGFLGMARQWMDQGIMIGEGRGPVETEPADSSADVWKTILQTIATVVERSGHARPMGAPVPGPAGPRAPRSEARVVGDAPAGSPPPPAAPPAGQTPWFRAVEMVYGGMLALRDPMDVVIGLEQVLPAEDLTQLRGGQDAGGAWLPTAEQVLAHPLLAAHRESFPQLWSPQGHTFVAQVLTAMRTQEDDSEAE